MVLILGAANDCAPQVEGSYREYHSTAFTAASIHPAEATQEAQRIRTAVCSLMGLRPPPPPPPEALIGGSGGGGGGVDQGVTAGMDGTGRSAEGEGAAGSVAGAEVRTAGETRTFELAMGLTGSHLRKNKIRSRHDSAGC